MALIIHVAHKAPTSRRRRNSTRTFSGFGRSGPALARLYLAALTDGYVDLALMDYDNEEDDAAS
jgi:hypothetical protein